MSSSAENPTLTTEITKPSTEIATETAQSAKKINLKTSDDQIFEVEESVAMEFATVKSFFEDAPSSTDTVPLPNVPAKPFSQVIEFCKEQIKFKANPDETEKKKSNSEFVKEKTNEDLVEMIPVANYLEIKDLLDVLNQAVADRIQNRSVEYVRSFFGIDNDFTSEEEALLREEHAWAFEDVDED
ncbi:SKP1 [Salix viminalis]|uniref:SKP1-like protein n=2 Tax=Salix TaxID=40685 RepID=A0A6N2LKS0_SALVM|nr:hypothetical protein OIU84_029702 [Salix udensis]KAJ6678152.1 SKP1 [Salix viminalis]